MGLTSWKSAPSGKIRKSDVSVAKNYLNEQELKNLNAFLQFNEYDILQNSGKITHEIAKAFAENEFEKFRTIQDKNYQSDFDKLIQKIT